MKIFINYENNKIVLNSKLITKNYQSINSIINDFLMKNNINEETQHFFLDYNGIYLNNNYSLEKYNIQNFFHLHLNKIVKGGGNSFTSFAKKNPAIVAISFIFALIPIIILPMGFISATASLLKIIMEKSFASIGRYFVCDLGKITLYKRFSLSLNVIKYTIFILMIYVIITFPLIILCITLKGHSLKDNPKDMCSGISTGNIAGIILTTIYVMIYAIFRAGNYILNPIIFFCKQIYILNTLLVPILSSILNLYNTSKYLIIGIIPVIGQIFITYFKMLELTCDTGETILESVTDFGCKMKFTKEMFMKSMNQKINNKTNDKKNEGEKNEGESNKINKEYDTNNKDSLTYTKENICDVTSKTCCSPDNFLFIGDNLLQLLDNSASSLLLKKTELYPSFILFTEGIFESALSIVTNGDGNFLSKDLSEKKIYLRKIIRDNVQNISTNTKDLIKKYLNNNNETLLLEISKDLDKDLDKNLDKNKAKLTNKINDIKYKLELLNQYMILYSKENNSAFIPGNTLFKTIMKVLFLDIFCNVVTTTNTSKDIILKMGKMVEVVDMLKAASSTGLFMSFIYLLTVIILIFCGIFNVF